MDHSEFDAAYTKVMGSNVFMIFSCADCSSDYLVLCGDGQCIDFYYWCDGIWDCNDGQDEAHCTPGKLG